MNKSNFEIIKESSPQLPNSIDMDDNSENFISDEMFDVVRKIATEHPNTVFCGSFALVIHGLLQRKVNDLDIITEKSYKLNLNDFFPANIKMGIAGSSDFIVDHIPIECIKLVFGKVKVDALFRHDCKPEYREVLIINKDYNFTIKVETPQSAIKFKKKYIKSVNFTQSVVKHYKDLIYLQIDKNELINLLDDVVLTSEPRRVEHKQSSTDKSDVWDDDNDLPF